MKRDLAIGMTILLAGCGGGGTAGVDFPDQYAGTWAADCSEPFVKFADGQVTLYPETKPNPVSEAKVDGSNLLVSFTRPDVKGIVTETYAIEGDMLRLTTTAIDGKVAATWTKRPMQKCS